MQEFPKTNPQNFNYFSVTTIILFILVEHFTLLVYSLWYMYTCSKKKRHFVSSKTLLRFRVRARAGISVNTFSVKRVFQQM